MSCFFFFCCSFVLNPLTPVQDTLCQLQNETSANNPAAVPQRSVNLYYMVKMQIRSGMFSCRAVSRRQQPHYRVSSGTGSD